MSDDSPLVLVVEDERDLCELYRTWLADPYRVRTAHDGQSALSELDADVDIVLLDRRMPDLSGDEVLDRIRERGLDCRVAMVTAVEPDTDIVEMAFDDYLVKPVSESQLVRTAENLRIRDEYGDGVKQLFSLASKRAILESEMDRAALRSDDDYRSLCEDLAALRAELDDKLSQLGENDDLTLIYQDLVRDDE